MGERVSLISKLKDMLCEQTALNGGVATGNRANKRVREIITHIGGLGDPYGLGDLEEGVSQDWYGPSTSKTNGRVSIETARDLESSLKNALDDAVEDENRYSSEPGRVSGDTGAPCLVLKRRKWY